MIDSFIFPLFSKPEFLPQLIYITFHGAGTTPMEEILYEVADNTVQVHIRSEK
tara:strand:- start:2176 stop:2334 length:159 start_codon:yes stop_codon:yes gene_type:complete